MERGDSPTLEVGFTIDTGGSFSELAQLQAMMGSTEAKIVGDAKMIETATRGMVNLGGATAQMTAFGSAATREMENTRRATASAEKAGEGMVRQLQRQAETYGKTTVEIRNMRAEQRALAAEGQGLTELAGRLRAANAEMVRLESGGLRGATKGSNQMRFAMQGASYQVQDLFTQISMGTNPINALAVQGGQLAGQFSNVEGKAGNFARFMIGPWGLAITGGALVLGPLIARLMESSDALADATDKLKKDAAETAIADRAKAAFGRTLEGLTVAARENEKALDALRNADRTAAQQAAISTQVTLTRIQTLRAETVAEIELARAMVEGNRLRASRGGAQQQDMAAATYLRESEKLAVLEASLTKIDGALSKAEGRAREAMSFAAVERGKLLSTSEGRINKQYDDLIEATRQRLEGEKASTAEIIRQTRALEAQRQLKLDQAKPSRSVTEETRDTATAASVAVMLRKILPGVQITSTTGGKHTDGSDHYKNRAVDFVPAGGMGSMNKGGIRALMQQMGLEIRRNGNGVEQLFGPGDKDHADHFHVAWTRGKDALDNYRTSQTAATKEAREQEAVYDRAVKGAHDYAEAQNATARQTTLNAKDQRAYADAVAMSAAVTDKDKQAIREAAAVRDAAISKADATAFQDNVIKPLQDELALYGLVGPARAAAALELEKEGFIAKNMDDGIAIATQRWNDYHAAKMGLINRDAAADMEVAAIQRLNDHLSSTASLMEMVDQQGQSLADSLSTAFGSVGDGLGDAITAITAYGATQANLDAQRHADQVKYAKDAKLLADSEVLYSKRSGLARQQAAMQAIGGIKSMFKEHSTAFKVMAAIEKGFAIWQAAQTAISIAQDIAKTVSNLANSSARAVAVGAEGVATQSKLPFPYNIAAMAATGAALVAAGIAVFGGGGRSSGPSMPSIEDVQAGQGTGSILGDSKAKSDSIARSLEIVASNTNRDLEYTNGMLKTLNSIDNGISKMAGTIARQIQVADSMFDTSKLNLGTSGSGGFLGIGAKSTTKTLYDAGMTLNSASVADIIANGIAGQTYQIVEKVKKKSGFLGIGGGTKTSFSTTTGALDGGITAAVQDVIASLRDGLVSAADVVGLEGAEAILNSFQVNIGKVSFKDMTGEEIEEQLNAIFSSVGDQMAGTVLPSLTAMQKVGEGLFETFIRVARQYEVVDVALRSIGKAFGAVGVDSLAARDALVQLFGGLDEFAEQTSYFRDKFLSEAEQIAPIAASVREEMARLGMAGITTRDQFKVAVLGLDLTSAAGREMYASLLAVAPAFDKVLEYFDQANKATIDGLKSTADQFNGFVASLTKYRDTLFATGVTQGEAYQALRSKFVATSALASGGDAAALGRLEGDGKAFLDVARNNASTREEYLRDVAIVARGVDAGIFAADATADYARLQFDALQNANSILGMISANTAMTAEALVVAAGASQAASTPTAANDTANLEARIDELRAELVGMRSENTAGLAVVAGNTGRMARKLDDVTAASGGDALSMTAVA